MASGMSLDLSDQDLYLFYAYEALTQMKSVLSGAHFGALQSSAYASRVN